MQMTYSSRLRVIATVVVTALACALPASAALRSPQVAVSGTALQAFFTAHGQSINASAAQQDIQRFNIPVSSSFGVQMFGDGTASFGAYNASAAVPALYVLMPGAVTPGWFVEASFRTAPQRMVVNLFDDTSALIGTTTYFGADNTDLGFYAQTAGGVFSTQDARNAGGAPSILVYSATGALAGSTWFACETSGGPGGDFADVIALVNLSLAPVPANSTTWSRVKALYK